MRRTTFLLPEALHARAVCRARALRIPLGEFIRNAVAAALPALPDPLFADDAVYDGAVPRDLAARHDEYAYDWRARRK